MNAYLSLIDALARTLLQFAWQGALIGAVAALALALLRDARPQARYLVACAALLGCLTWPALELAGRLGALRMAGAALHPAGAGVMLQGGHGAARWQSWLVGLWALGAALLALRLALGLAWIRHVRAFAPSTDADGLWQRRLSALALRFGVTRPVRLLIGTTLAAPVTAGCWRPFVIVPAALLSGMPAELLEALLAHEMAHIRRGDYLVGVAQNVIEALLFYHPAVWWISGRIRRERELAADALASRVTGEPRRLARALSELELLQFAPGHLAPSAAGGDLLQRIRALTAPAPASAGHKSAAAVLLALMLGATALSLAALPQQPAIAAAGTVSGDHAAVLNFATCRKPMYPPASLAAREEGTVHLKMLVGADGKIRNASISDSSGHPALDVEARDAIALCSFHPATRGGKPVETWTEVRYVWTLN
jgi:D-alanyl-D-alanine endopeptidase (penicillin-binding protein 7)